MFRAVFLTGIHLLLFDMIHMKIRQNGISISICRDQIQSHHKLYYKFLYIPPRMLYDGVGKKGMAQSERRNSEWIATLSPCVMNISNSCCAVLNKNCALLCFALK